jgi:hypothetical protein
VTRLTDRQLRLLARAAWWFFVLALFTRGALFLADPDPAAPEALAEGSVSVLALVAFPLSGTVILRRQPRNVVGWLLAVIGVVWALGAYGDTYAYYGLVIDPGRVPAPDVGALISNGIWAPALGLTGTFLFLLFPDGRLPSKRWRPFAWLCGAVIVVLTACLYLSSGELAVGPGKGLANPLAVETLGPAIETAFKVLIPLFAACIAGSAVALVVRFRRSRGTERLQLKWLATAAGAVGFVFLVGIFSSLTVPAGEPQPAWQSAFDQFSFLLFALIPIAIGVAVLRHRLYDIDVVINRALVYGSLTVCLAGVYLASVLLLQLALQPLTERSDLAVAASTLAVAALFGPARRRIQAAVDRRFYRHKYDASRTVAGFSSRLRQQIDLDSIGGDLVQIVDDTVQPTAVSLWLRPAVTVPGRPAPRKDTP